MDEADEAESLDSSAADVEAASAQPSADRTASAPLPLPVLHEEEEPVTLSVQSTERPENSAAESPAHSAAESPAHSAGAEHPEHSASGDAEQTGEEAADAGPEEVEEIPDRQDEPAECPDQRKLATSSLFGLSKLDGGTPCASVVQLRLEAPSEEPERTQADSVQDTAQDCIFLTRVSERFVTPADGSKSNCSLVGDVEAMYKQSKIPRCQDPAPRCPSGPDDASKDSEEPRKPKDHQACG